jgi:hypothetical protein
MEGYGKRNPQPDLRVLHAVSRSDSVDHTFLTELRRQFLQWRSVAVISVAWSENE